MNNLEKYLDQVIEQRPTVYEPPAETEPPQTPPPSFLQAVGKRWHFVPIAVVLVCAVGLPAIWFLAEPHYLVRGAVRVVPVVPGILTGDPVGGEFASYGDFVNTQASILVSGPILQQIADDLDGRDLSIFSGKPRTLIEKIVAKLGQRQRVLDPAAVLKDAVSTGTIKAGHVARTELIAVTMEDRSADEAKQIVDSFLINYRARYGTTSTEEETQNLGLLEEKRDELLTKIVDNRQKIRDQAEEFGTTALDSRQDMEIRRQTALLTELTRLEAKRISLEASIRLLEQTEQASISPNEVVAARQAYVNSDPMVSALAQNIVDMERDLIVARQALTAENPLLVRKQNLLDMFRSTLETKQAELEQEFDDGLEDRLKEAAQQTVANTKAELQQIESQYEAFRKVVNEQDITTRSVGQTNLNIQDLQFQVDLDQEMYDQVSRRLKSMEMERQRRPRIRLAYPAEIAMVKDKRIKFSAALVLASVACGFGLAFMRDKMDKTLQTPDDVTRYLDLPVIGTTTSSRTVKPKLFAEQIAGDYQTIRTNLGLLSSGGMPKRLAVSSAGMREGKTTFAVNLATSLAKSGKKVLLIDGDLRKPDIGYMLNIPGGSGGLQEVLLGEDPSGIVCAVPSSGLHVLAANPRSLTDPYEILNAPTAAGQIKRLGQEYDHLIIDTPPALAFPDALVWAKLADAVLLVSFAGQTTAPELKEAKERFARIRVRVLGAVLSNVPVDQSLYRYGYTYRAQTPQAMRKARKPKKLLLPTHGKDGDVDTGGA